MNDDMCRIDFEPSVPLMDPEMSLHLAMFAAEGLLGRARYAWMRNITSTNRINQSSSTAQPKWERSSSAFLPGCCSASTAKIRFVENSAPMERTD
jgi:S-methylmethionine-dependent homocysteine/selenocysteine methylase